MISNQDGLSVPVKLDYQYGAKLKPRPPLVFKDPTYPTITFALSFIHHPTYFYVHLKQEEESLLNPLIKKLNDIYRDSEPVPVTHPEVGSFWVAKEAHRDMWSRFAVVSVNLGNAESGGNSSALLLSVDWGFFETVELSQLRPLVKDVLDIPCLAIGVRLAGIYPPNQTTVTSITSWTSILFCLVA